MVRRYESKEQIELSQKIALTCFVTVLLAWVGALVFFGAVAFFGIKWGLEFAGLL